MERILKTWKIIPWSSRIGLGIITLYAFAALFAPMVAPYPESSMVGDVWEEIGGRFLLGTDQLGRDLWTRLLFGARNTISIALLITLLAFLGGTVSGLLAAVLKGWVDQALSRIVDILLSIPPLIFALIVLSVVGTSIPVLIVVIAVIYTAPVYRISRAVAMDIEVMDYVEVARLRGEGLWWIMRHEVLPNALTPLMAEFGLRFCFVFLLISSLSFLGLGLQPPLADWGAMVRENAGAITFGIMIPLLPAGAIALLTIAVNLVVDWLVHKASGLREDH